MITKHSMHIEPDRDREVDVRARHGRGRGRERLRAAHKVERLPIERSRA
jgi:hypothetical protein